MKEIVVKKCKLGSFFKRRQSLKIGVEGSRMHDILVSQSDNNLACFFDEGTKKYYLYSLVSGELIDSSLQEIECLGDYYYEKYGKDYGITNQLLVCKVDFENNKYKVIASNEAKQYYSNDRNMLVLYNPKSKAVYMVDMNTNKNYIFTFKDLPDTEFLSIDISYNLDSESNFLVCVTFANNDYFNFFNINTNTFTFKKFFEGEVWNIKEYNNKLYIITHNSELLDETGNVLIDSIYDDIEFWGFLPYVVIKKDNLLGFAQLENGEVLIEVKYDNITLNLISNCATVEKDGKYGLVDLETGKIIFEPKYDEIINEDQIFRAVTKTYKTYLKEKNKIID